jgi:hypothetical protein
MTSTDATVAPAWPAYEEAMPHTRRSEAPAAAATFAELRRRRGADGSVLAAVRHVIVVVSSSRGGSTVVGELFRRTPGMLTLPAETNPLFAVAALEAPTDGIPARRTPPVGVPGAGRQAGERAVPESPGREPRAAVGDARAGVLAAELAVDIGEPAGELPLYDREAFADALAWRLVAQWPAAGIDPDDVARWADETFRELAAADPAWVPPGFPDRVEFHVRLLAKVRAAHPAVDPWYYDLPADRIRAAFPDVPEPAGPPGEHLVEMPPFVLAGPWRRATPAELADRTLVLTTPRNAFRLSFLRSLFPVARFEVLHLVRNPAAAVNGLIDGWCHRGFFHRAVDIPLRITGYSDRFPRWGRRWWNFDFWPGWEQWSAAPLAEVCAEQWRSAHQAVLDWVSGPDAAGPDAAGPDTAGIDYRRLRFEDVAAGDALRRLPPVMATAPPRPRRWVARADVILPAVTAGPVADLAEELGYAGDPATWR